MTEPTVLEARPWTPNHLDRLLGFASRHGSVTSLLMHTIDFVDVRKHCRERLDVNASAEDWKRGLLARYHFPEDQPNTVLEIYVDRHAPPGLILARGQDQKAVAFLWTEKDNVFLEIGGGAVPGI